LKDSEKNTIPFFLAKLKKFFTMIKKKLKEKWSSFTQKRKEQSNQSDAQQSTSSNHSPVESKQPNTNPETLDDKFIGILLAAKGWVVVKSKNIKNTITKKNPENNNEESTRSNRYHSFFFGFNVTYNVLKNLFIALIIFLLVGVAFAGGTGLGYFAYLVSKDEPPTYKEMNADLKNIETTSSIYYAGGELISDLRTDLKRTTMPLEDMSDLVQKAIIATEDEYFYEHNGVVPKAIARALFQEITGASSVSGGSTLTQQLVKQQILTNEVSFKRKANEILLAYRLENFFSKDEILESYLNVSPFGRNNHGENIAGLHEASSGIFGVASKKLTLPQAAFIAGLPQNPIVYSPYSQYGEVKDDLSAGFARKDEVLFRMYREGSITKKEYDKAKSYDLAADFVQQDTTTKQNNSYIYNAVEKEARKVLMEQLYTADKFTATDLAADKSLYDEYYEKADQKMRMNGYQIKTTIDKFAYDAMQNVVTSNAKNLGYKKEIDWKNPETGETTTIIEPVQNGSVLLDNETGAILSFVGGVDFNLSQVNHAFDTNRSPGSTIKPILVYAPALENGTITPATIVPQTKLVVPDGVTGTHEITNHGNSVPETWISARKGLAASSNIVASRIYMEMQKSFVPGEYLQKMGIGTDSIAEEEYKNISLAIGGTDGGASVLEQTTAFSTLANKGTHTENYMIESIEDSAGDVLYQHEEKSNPVFTPQTAYLTIDMMRDVLAAGTATDVESQLTFSADLAGKTGTSDLQKDIWFIASTPKVTLSSWIGYDNSVEENYLDLSSGAGSSGSRNRTYWAQLANAINNANPTIMGANQSFQQPKGIVPATVNEKTGTKAGKVKLADGKEITVSGETKTEIFNSKYLPKAATYNFAVGASNKDLKDFWGGVATAEEKAEAEKAKAEADKKAEVAEEKKAKEEKEDNAKAEAESKAKIELEKQAEAEAKKKADAEAKAKAESEAKKKTESD